MGSAQGKDTVDMWRIQGFDDCVPCPSPAKTYNDDARPQNQTHDKAVLVSNEKINMIYFADGEMNEKIKVIDNETLILYAAVNSAAIAMGVDPPGYSEFNSTYNGRFFLSDEAKQFWVHVSHHFPDSSPSDCFLRYKELHCSDLARIISKVRIKSKWSSTGDMDTSIGKETSISRVNLPSSRRRHSQNG
jgi:hypothetical protein